MSVRRIFLLPIGLALASCSNTPAAQPPVRVATQDQVGQCAYVTNIQDKPGLYGAFASQGISYARNAILNAAAQAGANTVVFEPIVPGGMVTMLKATAYRC